MAAAGMHWRWPPSCREVQPSTFTPPSLSAVRPRGDAAGRNGWRNSSKAVINKTPRWGERLEGRESAPSAGQTKIYEQLLRALAELYCCLLGFCSAVDEILRLDAFLSQTERHGSYAGALTVFLFSLTQLRRIAIQRVEA